MRGSCAIANSAWPNEVHGQTLGGFHDAVSSLVLETDYHIHILYTSSQCRALAADNVLDIHNHAHTTNIRLSTYTGIRSVVPGSLCPRAP